VPNAKFLYVHDTNMATLEQDWSFKIWLRIGPLYFQAGPPATDWYF